MRDVLIVAETALAVVLRAGSAMLRTSYGRLMQVDGGFDPENLVMTEVILDDSYATSEKRAAYFDEMLAAVATLPGVESVSAIPDPPISGYSMWAPSLYPEGRGSSNAEQMGAHLIGPDYFETMRIRLLGGRAITSRDNAGSLPVIVLSESAAKRLWPGEDPVGKRLQMSGDAADSWRTVIGMVADIRQHDLATGADPNVYVPYAQGAWYGRTHLIARTRRDAAAMVAPIRRVLRELDSGIPFDGVSTMTGRISRSMDQPRFHATLLTLFAAMALLLASAGIYATMLYAVGQRTREIAIRIALGARPANVLGLVVRQGMLLTAMGVAVGLACTLALTRVIASLVFEAAGTDPAALLIAVSVLAIAALLACCVPGLRATRLDPNHVLRAG